MGSNLINGLQLSVIGLGVTFLALGLLILVMNLLQRVFPIKPAITTEESAVQTDSEDEDEQRLEEMAVALAVGICLLEREGAMGYQDPSLGKLLEK
jgi:Na+-transporting methylmalonyl-CoA/oxaloacetate decarboxylase gamma subunit